MFSKKSISILLGFVIIFIFLGYSKVNADGINGWSQEGQIWRYYNDGVMEKSYWVQDSLNQWYYLDENGAMITNGWVHDSLNQWYYLSENGVMKTSGWVQDSIKRWYYFSANGIMQIGWVKTNGKWYYFNTDGVMLSNKWLRQSEKMYYFNKNGEMEIEKKYIRLPSKIAVDYPRANNEIKNSFFVSGWSLNDSGVKEVKLYIDGEYIGNALTGFGREDINKAYPEYIDGDISGYYYDLDIDKISGGLHNLKIQSIGNDGTSIETIRQINIVKLEPRIAMDFPRVNSEIENSFSVGGWALNSSAVKNVEVYVDDVFRGNATIGIERLDVNGVFQGYKEGYKGGYNFNIDIDTIKAGTRNIKVRAIGYDGSTIESTRNVNIVKIPSKIAVDTPRMNTEIRSNFYVNGWAINASGIEEVNIYVDDKFMGQADIGISRPDVNSVYPGYRNGDKGGYSYDLSVYDISLGKHVVKIQAVGLDGELINTYTNIDVKDNTKRFVYSEKTLDEMINLEYARNPKYGTGREATMEEVAYYVNPDNFIHSEYGRYMFMKLSYMDGIDVNDLNNMLGGKGVLQGKGDIFLKAGKNSGINPIYLISHALLETGNGTSKLANGSLSYNGATIYNAYGVGATDDDPNFYGSKYAYEHGWFTLDAAILGGAEFISKNYIKSSKYNSNYQDTLYKMRWNDEQMWHQYATDVGWAYKQIANIKRLIDMCESSTNYFEIPTYK